MRSALGIRIGRQLNRREATAIGIWGMKRLGFVNRESYEASDRKVRRKHLGGRKEEFEW